MASQALTTPQGFIQHASIKELLLYHWAGMIPTSPFSVHGSIPMVSATSSTIFILYLLLLPISSPRPRQIHAKLLPVIDGDGQNHDTYIVHVERPKNTTLLDDEWLRNYHLSFLPNVTLDSGETRLVYSYREAISGFAARLTPDEVRAMQSIDGFLHAYIDRQHRLLTTYTPEFLGLSNGGSFWTTADYGSGAIIGILDTGVETTHPSFNDNGMPPPPPYWQGGCDSVCNNKIIGTKSFKSSSLSSSISSDDNNNTEHGTHVASIAAGIFVENAEVLDTANGIAAGMAPKAHLAIYQVCSLHSCADSDVLAGIDQAIYDQVDIISVSFGSAGSRPYYEDGVAMGSYSALRRKILTVAAAGNGGPAEGTVGHDAPWILTVGASTTDRRIAVTVNLADGMELAGESAYQPSSFNSTQKLPLAFPGFRLQGGREGCRNDSFNGVDVRGKMVLCEVGFDVKNIEKGENVKNAGGAAMVLLNQAEQGETTLAEAHVLPAAHLNYSAACSIISYYNSSISSTPTAAIAFNGTILGAPSSPAVASFSSRGPSSHNGGILKPDIVGPGVNILGAWPSKVGPDLLSTASSPERNFNFQSGTSTATPHISGIAALLRTSHPHWTASAIKSAIMTTADVEDREGNPITDQLNKVEAASRNAMGAGQVNPSKADNPGLVYNLHSHRYKRYLCSLGYTNRQVTMITQHHTNCLRYKKELGPEHLNYPSISVVLGSPLMKTVRRWVKNVGESNVSYYAKIESPQGVKVDVYPPRLYFPRRYETRRFQVVLTAENSSLGRGQVAVGHLHWVSTNNIVKSPISVTLT